MLAGVGEVETEHLDVAAGAGEPRLGGDPDQVAAEGHDDALEPGVAPDRDRVLGGVHGVVGPVVDDHDGELGAVADQELDVVGVGRAADVVEHDQRLAERLDVDEQVAEGRALVDAVAAQRDDRGRAGDRVAWDRDDGGLLERRPGARRHPVGRHAGLAEAGVAAGRASATSTSGAGVDLDGDAAVAGGVVLVQVPQAVQRGEPPVLLAAGGHVEVGQLERAVPLAPAVTGDRCRAVRVRLAAEPAGLRAEDLGRLRWQRRAQPTAPSICSSMSRLSSRAYSIGSSLAIGSTKPRTIIAIASSSVSPRLIR